MKLTRILALVLTIALCFGALGMLTSCGGEAKNYAAENTKIKIGLSGPLSGGAASYGIAVNNSAKLAVKEINAAGGLEVTVNGEKVNILFELEMKDDQHDASKIPANYNTLYEGGMQVSLGTVTTAPGLSFKEYAYDNNVFFLTPSASGDDVPEYNNGYQMCFADSNQGTVSAQEFNRDYQGKSIGVFYQADDDYSKGIYEQFKKALDKSFTLKEASFTKSTASSFAQQITELKNCDVIFMPIYYGPAALFMTQGKDIVKSNAIYYGCDGLDGIDAVEGFDITSIPQEVSYLSHFNSNATTGAARAYIDAYVAEYGASAPLNQFGAAAYDCVYAIFEAMKVAVANGEEITAGIAPSALCKILRNVFNSETFVYRGITGAPEADGKSNITWDDNGYVNKLPIKYTVKEVSAN